MARTGYPVSWRDAIYLQFSGITMSMTPGRVGEVLKPWLGRRLPGMPLSRGVALVFVERLSDLMAVSLLSLGALTFLGDAALGILGVAAIVGLMAALAGSRWFRSFAVRFLSRQKWACSYAGGISDMSDTIEVALRPLVLIASVLASVLSWGMEGVGFYLCLRALGFAGIDVVGALAVHAVSAIVGVITLLPGGIGLTEASMAGILITLGMDGSAGHALETR